MKKEKTYNLHPTLGGGNLIFRKSLFFVLFAFVVLQRLAGCSPGVDVYWPVSYPYQLNIQEGSSAWIVTSDLCEKTTTLRFDWDESSKILTVNGARVYPGVYEESQYNNERDRERIYGEFPTIKSFHVDLGTWMGAVEKYRSIILDFKFMLNSKCREFRSGEITEADLRQYFRDSLTEYPYSAIFSVEKGLELQEKGFVIYANRPQPGFTPHYHLYNVVEVKQRESIIGSKDRADTIVRQVVGHYKAMPHLPHIVFLGNGGASQLCWGVETVSKIEGAISRALAEQSVPEGLSPISKKILRRIVDQVEGAE